MDLITCFNSIGNILIFCKYEAQVNGLKLFQINPYLRKNYHLSCYRLTDCSAAMSESLTTCVLLLFPIYIIYSFWFCATEGMHHMLCSKYQGYEEHRSGNADPGRMAPVGFSGILHSVSWRKLPKGHATPWCTGHVFYFLWFSIPFTSDCSCTMCYTRCCHIRKRLIPVV